VKSLRGSVVVALGALALCAPVAALAAPAVDSLAAGGDETCALIASGGVYCWGANGDGQLGDGTATGPQRCNGDACSAAPVPVRGVASASAIAAGGDSACALLAGGAIDCWGANGDGQLGDGTATGPQRCSGQPCATTPVAVTGATGATAVSVGGDHACALLATGAIDCWGANGDGQLGDGTATGPQRCNGQPCATTPVPVHGITAATAVSAGGSQTCALLRGGSVSCWGANGYGQLGEGSSFGPQSCGGEACSTDPVAVGGIAGATQLAAGADHACALLAAGTVSCWGYNFAGELGVGTSSGPQLCGRGGGGGWCSTKPTAAAGVSGAVALSAGGDHTCALQAGGTLACWGYNTYGQLALPSAGPQICYWQLVQCAKSPRAPSSIQGVAVVAAGGDHTCALLRTGTVECWGSNWFGELGVRSGPSDCNGYPCSTSPVRVAVPGTSSAARTGRRAPAAAARRRRRATSAPGS